MASWTDGVSAAAQTQLDRLLASAIPLAQSHLAHAHEFDPFAIFLREDDRVLEISLDLAGLGRHPETVQVRDAALAQLVRLRDQARCTAITSNTHLRKERTDAIEIALEHAEGAAVTVLLPYKRAKFGSAVDYGTLRAFAGIHEVWR
jgi:hypothetical protein